jgi:hypothetical protein
VARVMKDLSLPAKIEERLREVWASRLDDSKRDEVGSIRQTGEMIIASHKSEFITMVFFLIDP